MNTENTTEVKDELQNKAETTAQEAKSELSPKDEKMQLDVNEQQLIANERERKTRLENCNKKLIAVLKEFDATLQINPRSPVGNPQIMVVVNK